MITGALNWNNRDKIFYSQENNAIEKYNKGIGQSGYLETCGPSSAIICCAAVITDDMMKTSLFDGLPRYKVQPEDFLFAYLYNPSNFPRIKLPNRINACYPYAVQDLFNINCKEEKVDFLDMVAYIKQGFAIQFAFYNPNHYNAAVAYDDSTGEILRVDPWPSNPMNKKGGWHERITEKEFNANIKKDVLLYWV